MKVSIVLLLCAALAEGANADSSKRRRARNNLLRRPHVGLRPPNRECQLSYAEHCGEDVCPSSDLGVENLDCKILCVSSTDEITEDCQKNYVLTAKRQLCEQEVQFQCGTCESGDKSCEASVQRCARSSFAVAFRCKDESTCPAQYHYQCNDMCPAETGSNPSLECVRDCMLNVQDVEENCIQDINKRICKEASLDFCPSCSRSGRQSKDCNECKASDKNVLQACAKRGPVKDRDEIACENAVAEECSEVCPGSGRKGKKNCKKCEEKAEESLDACKEPSEDEEDQDDEDGDSNDDEEEDSNESSCEAAKASSEICDMTACDDLKRKQAGECRKLVNECYKSDYAVQAQCEPEGCMAQIYTECSQCITNNVVNGTCIAECFDTDDAKELAAISADCKEEHMEDQLEMQCDNAIAEECSEVCPGSGRRGVKACQKCEKDAKKSLDACQEPSEDDDEDDEDEHEDEEDGGDDDGDEDEEDGDDDGDENSNDDEDDKDEVPENDDENNGEEPEDYSSEDEVPENDDENDGEEPEDYSSEREDLPEEERNSICNAAKREHCSSCARNMESRACERCSKKNRRVREACE